MNAILKVTSTAIKHTDSDEYKQLISFIEYNLKHFGIGELNIDFMFNNANSVVSNNGCYTMFMVPGI